jgi:hypothetical protein
MSVVGKLVTESVRTSCKSLAWNILNANGKTVVTPLPANGPAVRVGLEMVMCERSS